MTEVQLNDVGDGIFSETTRLLRQTKRDGMVEITQVNGPLQENLTLYLPDRTNILVKTFPHKDFQNEPVFRIEVYQTRPGDPRGNRIAFVEIPRRRDALSEISTFLDGVLVRSGLIPGSN